MPEAVNLFAVESPYEIRNLRNRLITEQVELNAQLHLADDWANFKYRQGRLHGITRALDILDEMNKGEKR